MLKAISEKQSWNDWVKYFLKAITDQAHRNTQRAKHVTELYEKLKNEIPEISKSRNAIQIQDFLFSKIMFETPDFTKSSNLSKPHATRVLKKLLENKIVKTVSPAKGRRPAMYVFTALMEIIEQ